MGSSVCSTRLLFLVHRTLFLKDLSCAREFILLFQGLIKTWSGSWRAQFRACQGRRCHSRLAPRPGDTKRCQMWLLSLAFDP